MTCKWYATMKTRKKFQLFQKNSNNFSKFWTQFWEILKKIFKARFEIEFSAWKLICAPSDVEIGQSVQFCLAKLENLNFALFELVFL